MTSTLAVVGLDAADYELARRWDCENVLLDDHREMETFSYSYDQPYTPEVWTTVATGLHPRDHGVHGDAADWDSLPLRAASKLTQHLHPEVRQRLGQPFRDRGHEQEIDRTDAPSAFDAGAAMGWPGITDAEHLSEAWSWASEIKFGELTERQLRRNVYGNTGEEFGFLVGMDGVVPIAGVHSHVLDVVGHVFAKREAKLREFYERVDELLGVVRRETDEMVVLSDHGMKVSWVDEGEVGVHSNRAMVAATEGVAGDLPASVFDVKSWLEANTDADDADDRDVTMDTAEQRLEELGYIE